MSFNPIDFMKTNLKPSSTDISDIQNKMMEVQKRLAALEVEGIAGLDGFSVRVFLNGRYESTRVIIEPSILDQGVEIFSSLIASAITDAAHKTEVAIQREFMNAMQRETNKLSS